MMTVFLFYPNGYGVSLTGVYVVWMLVIAILYPYCRWVAAVKAQRRDWWLSSLRVVSMPKNIFFNCLLIATAFLCVSSSGCRQERKVEVAPVSIELTAMDQSPDSQSMAALRSTVAEVVHALRNGQQRSVYELFAPEIRRAVPFYEFLQRFERRTQPGIESSRHICRSLTSPACATAWLKFSLCSQADSTRDPRVHLDLLAGRPSLVPAHNRRLPSPRTTPFTTPEA